MDYREGVELKEAFDDHARFCSESLTVETEDNRLIPMVMGPGQIKLHEGIRKQRAQGRPVRIIYLKSRRIQATTGTAAEFFHWTPFVPSTHTIVIAHSAKSVNDAIFPIYKRFHEKYKKFQGLVELPGLVNTSGKPIKMPLTDRLDYANGSYIQIHTAGNLNFGRGFRFDNVHFSEFPYYDDPAATRAAVMSGVAKLPSTTVIIEGTAKTVGDEFHKMVQAAQDHSDSDWLLLFMGWWEHPSNRMPLAVPPDRFQESMTREERDELMPRFRLSLEQINWRRWTIKNDFNGDKLRFTREHPATIEEAFTASARNRFSIPHVMRMPVIQNAVCGELDVNEIEGDEKQYIFRPGERGALKIFRMPEKGKFYGVGADPSGGADMNRGEGEPDPDWAVGQVLDRHTGEQCAVLRLRSMPGEFGRYVNRLVRFYNNAQVCLERTGAGVGSLEALLNCDYPAGKIYHRPIAPDQDPQVRSDKIGWETGVVSRQQLISALDDAIRLGQIYVHDPITQQELLTFIINERGKAEAQKGCKDDTVLALALAVIVLGRMPMPAPPRDSLPPPRVGRYGQPQREDPDRRGNLVRLR